MKHIKKALFLLPILLLTSCNFKYTYSIAGYNGAGGGGADVEEEDDAVDKNKTYDIKIWVDTKIESLTRTQVKLFESASGYKVSATVEPVSEGSAAANMLQDVSSGADLFVFAQDQLARLKVAGALSKITGNYAEKIKRDHSADSVKAASLGDSVYAYPMTSDNGYFLMYDKRILGEADVGNMTTMLNKIKAYNAAEGKNYKLYFKARGDGFYAASYFLAKETAESEPLCSSDWEIDPISGKFTSYVDTFDASNGHKGLIAAKAIKEIADSTIVAADNSASKFGSAAAAIVTGIWDYDVAYKRLGIKDDKGEIVDSYLGCAELPYYTVDGKDYHLGSYDGYKLLGIKPQPQKYADKAVVCRKLAQYLTNTSCQTNRFKEVSWGPTNIEASGNKSVQSHPGLAALMAQHKYATQQGQCPGSWFLALKTAVFAITPSSTDDKLLEILENYRKGLPDLLSDD